MTARPVSVGLTGVAETALWNLYQRAAAARAGLLDDPQALEMIARLDYPFERFDSRYGALAARMHAARVRTVDTALRQLLVEEPDATVVALGEGLETQFWRVDNGRVRWLTVDLPEIISVRRQVLPALPRTALLAGSATETDWIEQLDRTRPVIITAQGLLMYFDRNQVHRTLTGWARRLPGAHLVFDAVTPALQTTRRRTPTNKSYQPPPWPWTVDSAEVGALRALHGVSEVRQLPPTHTMGLLGLLERVPVAQRYVPMFPVFQVTLG